MEAELANASESYFGTPDYESVLSILPAYDGAVKNFKKEQERIFKKYGKGKDD